MATSVMQRQKTGSWSAIFPTDQVTQQQSALFVKKLLAVAISNITYLRTIFPEHAFGDRCLEDLNLKILRDDSACPGACQVIQWVKGCFDALDRKYLRMIVVGIYADNTEPLTAVETYTFKFDYNDQKGITIFRNDTQVTSAYTETETKRATIKLLRTIIVLTQTLQPLPDDVMMTMKLCYYDDVTPEDYEPPGFEPTNNDDFLFEDNPVTIRVGDVNTPFHAVKLRIKTKRSQFSVADGEDTAAADEGMHNCDNDNGHFKKDDSDGSKATISKQEGVISDIIADTGQAKGVAHEPTKQECGRNQEDRVSNKHKMEVDEAEDSMEGDEGESQATPSLDDTDEGEGKVTAEDNTVRCPCGVNEDDGLMVLCGSCQVWQHAVCYCLLKEENVPDLHICVACAKRGRGTCTDSSLLPLNQTRLQNLCLWRRTLQACTELTRVLPSGLARRLGVNVSAAQGIIERLEHEGFIRPTGKSKRLGRTVIKEKIMDEAIPKYLTIAAKQNKSKCSKKQTVNDRDPKAAQLSKPLPATNGVDSLAQKASHLNIAAAGSGHVPEKKPGDLPKLALARKQLPKGASMEVENCEVRRSPRILAKRVRSAVDETQEFEVSCSQDTSQQQDDLILEEGRARKRRKASIASHAIMV